MPSKDKSEKLVAIGRRKISCEQLDIILNLAKTGLDHLDGFTLLLPPAAAMTQMEYIKRVYERNEIQQLIEMLGGRT